MRRLAYMVSLALVAVLVLAPGATAQQMNGKHMMPDGTMMDDSQMMGGNTMASPPPRLVPHRALQTTGGRWVAPR